MGTDFGATKAAGRTMYNSFGKDLMKATMIATGGLSGGISATIAGGNFWNGFRQGIISSGLNHVAHLVTTEIDDSILKEQLKSVTSIQGYLNSLLRKCVL